MKKEYFYTKLLILAYIIIFYTKRNFNITKHA